MEGAEGGEEHSSDHAGGVGVSLEMHWALGDTKTFGLTPARQEHYDF